MKTPRRIRNGSEDHVDSPNPVDHPGCLFAVFAGLFPRLAVLLIWLARPLYVDAVFGGNWLWPVLGVIFLPLTTLMYVLMWTPGIGLVGLALAGYSCDSGYQESGEHGLCQPRPLLLHTHIRLI